MTDTKQTGRVKRALLSMAVLALLALVLQSLVFSGAAFTSDSGNPANLFTAGRLSHVNSHDGQVVLAATAMRPGTSRSGTLTLSGEGDVTALYSVSSSGLSETAGSGLSGLLRLRIQDVTGAPATLYDGTVAAFATATLGPIAPGKTRAYDFALTFPAAGATSAMQGAALRLDLLFTGVSP